MSRLRSGMFATGIGFLLGLAAAAWASSLKPAPAADSPSSQLPEQVSHSAPTSVSAPVENVHPSGQQPDRSTDGRVTGPDQAPLWRTLAAVAHPGKHAEKWVKVPALCVRGSVPTALNPEFSEFFGLTTSEHAALEIELDTVLAHQAALDLQAAQPIDVGVPNGLIKFDLALRVAPYPEAGAAIYDRLREILWATLGPERMEVYENWATNSLLADWRGIGLNERTIHLGRETASTSNEHWNMAYLAKTPDGEGQSFMVMDATLEQAERSSGFPIKQWLKEHPPSDSTTEAPPTSAGSN